MDNNSLAPTQFWPFDDQAPVNSVPIPSAYNSTGGFNGPYLTAQQAFELCYNTKAMALLMPSYDFFDSSGAPVGETAAANIFIINRYIVGPGATSVRFASVPSAVSADNQVLNFFIDFSLGANCFGPSSYSIAQNAWFTPISQFFVNNAITSDTHIQYTLSGGSAAYSGIVSFAGFNSQFFGDVPGIDVGVTSTTASSIYPPLQNSEGYIYAIEKIDEINFTPTNITNSSGGTITLVCPATSYAVTNNYNTPVYRTGFQYLSEIWLEGCAPIELYSPANITPPYFKLTTNSLGVQDTAVITLPANSGALTGKIGMTMSYPVDVSGNSGSSDPEDYFETLQVLTVT